MKLKYKQHYLYALELQDGCYYVGMTTSKDAVRRYKQHTTGKGAQWTRRHKPIQILEVRDIGATTQSEAARAENELTIEYIDKHGIEVVRGGGMCFNSRFQCMLAYNELKGRTYEVEIPVPELNWLRYERP